MSVLAVPLPDGAGESREWLERLVRAARVAAAELRGLDDRSVTDLIADLDALERRLMEELGETSPPA